MKLFIDGKLHPLHQAFEQHLSGISPEQGWDIRGLSGHNLQRDEFNEMALEAARGFNGIVADKQRLKPLIERLTHHYQALKKGESIADVAQLETAEVHLIVGFMRTGGTYLFKQLMQSCGLDHRQFLQKMTHDSLPSYHLCVAEYAEALALELSMELAEYTLWLEDCWPKQAPLVQKRIAYGHDIPRFNRIFGRQPHWWATLRDPSWAIDSFFNMESIDATANRHFPPFWQMAVQRFGEESKESWLDKPNYQKALDGWSMYHLDLFKGLQQLDPSQYTLIPFEHTAEMGEAGPRKLDFSAFKAHSKERPAYFDAQLQNQAIDRVIKAVDKRFHPYLTAYKS